MTYDKLMESILTAQEAMLKHKIEANSVTLNGRKYGKLIENCPPNMKPTIFGMTVKADYTMPDDYDFLVQYDPPQPQTNADRIRAMSDETLAKFLCTVRRRGTCLTRPEGKDCPVGGCVVCWMEWLREKAEQ